MIEVQALKEKGHYKSFHIQGHAGYADAGEDIVCAAVSALVINTINSIEEFTEDAFTCDCKDGMIESWHRSPDGCADVGPSEHCKIIWNGLSAGG